MSLNTALCYKNIDLSNGDKGIVQKNLSKVACLGGKVLRKCSFIESVTWRKLGWAKPESCSPLSNLASAVRISAAVGIGSGSSSLSSLGYWDSGSEGFERRRDSKSVTSCCCCWFFFSLCGSAYYIKLRLRPRTCQAGGFIKRRISLCKIPFQLILVTISGWIL